MRIVKDKIYSTMYRIKFKDGSLSDMYNLTRVRDHMRNLSNITS